MNYFQSDIFTVRGEITIAALQWDTQLQAQPTAGNYLTDVNC